MNCPVCDARLRTVQKHGVEVDICPDCKGIWLDRGEIEKIIEFATQGGPVSDRSDESIMQQRSEYPEDHERGKERHHEDYDHREHDHNQGYDPRTGKRRQRGSWLSDIFENFGGGD